MIGSSGEHPLDLLRRLDWWLVLNACALVLCGLVFIHSATRFDTDFAGQHLRQALFVAISVGLAGFVLLLPYPRIMRWSWALYGLSLLALVGLRFFGSTINGATRWYRLPGFAVQPSEFAKVAVVLALAAWLRFRDSGRLRDNLLVPLLIAGVPALLVMLQPDLGSSLVFWPVVLAMSFAAGARLRHLLVTIGLGLLVLVLGYFFFLRDYQVRRVEVWMQHFSWTENLERLREEARVQSTGPAVGAVEQLQAGAHLALHGGGDLAAAWDASGNRAELAAVEADLRDVGYQSWQSLIAIGSGGLSGAGLGRGPQNAYDFLPYRNADYIFAVIAEETGLLGVLLILGLQIGLVVLLLGIAVRSRERYGRLLVVGVAAFVGSQTWMHVAVCVWLVPATGLPMPLISYGGSSTMAAVLALGLALNVSARRQPVVAADAFR